MNRFLIKLPETEGNLENRVLTASVKEVASPTKMRNLMLARFDPKQAEVNDLRQYFGNDKFSIIGNAVDIQLDKQKYPLSDDKFIVFYYRVDNNPISKKIGHQDQTLVLEKDAWLPAVLGLLRAMRFPIWPFTSTKGQQTVVRRLQSSLWFLLTKTNCRTSFHHYPHSEKAKDGR